MKKKLLLLVLVIFLMNTTNLSYALPIAIDVDDEEDQHYNYGSSSSKCRDVYDPYEKINRKIFIFNGFLDYLILRPIAIGYKKATNDYIKVRVGSFLENINVPLTTVNYGFQANGTEMLRSFWRFAINTTLGVGGLFDVASKIGLDVEPQTFGSTLAHYGVGPGPYLVLPLLGSSNARDFSDPLITNSILNPVKYFIHKDFKLIISGGKVVHERMVILPFTDHVTENSTDFYIAIRSAAFQNRESKIEYPKLFICPRVAE